MLTQLTSSCFLPATSVFLVCYEMVSAFRFFCAFFFIHTLSCSISHSFINNLVSIHDTRKKRHQNLLRKVFKQFCMPSTSVMKFNIMKLRCLSENKWLTFFLMNLNCNWKPLRWWQKLFSRRLKNVLFFFLGQTNQFWMHKRRSFYVVCWLG